MIDDHSAVLALPTTHGSWIAKTSGQHRIGAVFLPSTNTVELEASDADKPPPSSTRLAVSRAYLIWEGSHGKGGRGVVISMATPAFGRLSSNINGVI